MDGSSYSASRRNTGEETIKMRLLLALAGFAVGFVVPALAQEQKTVDPEVRQQIEAVLTKYEDAFNKHHAAAIAALYTADADEVFEKEEAFDRALQETEIKWGRTAIAPARKGSRVQGVGTRKPSFGVTPV
jgi:hypothetical protein